jgi:hypothetical protein
MIEHNKDLFVSLDDPLALLDKTAHLLAVLHRRGRDDGHH